MGNRTKKAIINSYIELMSDDSYEKVTVTDLVEKCSISRQTFYYHFDSINEMIKWSLYRDIDEACKGISTSQSLLDANKPNVIALNKYTQLIKKATKAEEIEFLFSTIQKCTSKFLTKYIEDKTKFSVIEHYDFLLDSWAYAIAGRIIAEAKKESPDYNAVAEQGYNLLIEAFASIK